MVLQQVIYSKYEFFTQEEKSYLQKVIGSHKCCTVDDSEEYILLKIWKSVDENTTQYQKDLLIDLVERLYVEHEVPVLHYAFKGENVAVDILLDSDDDFTGSFLLARNDEDKTALSDDTLQGTNASTQTVKMIDLDMEAEDFYKVLILLETDDGQGAASGNVEAVVNEIFLYLATDVDSA